MTKRSAAEIFTGKVAVEVEDKMPEVRVMIVVEVAVPQVAAEVPEGNVGVSNHTPH